MVRRWQGAVAAVVLFVSLVVEAVVRERIWVRCVFWRLMYIGVNVRDWGHQPNDPQYEAFLDELPVTRFSLDVGQRAMFGPERTRRIPRFMDRFDWIVDHFPYGSWPRMPKEISEFIRGLGMTADVRRLPDPSTVYCAPHAVRGLLAKTGTWAAGEASRRSLVIAGTDMHLSEALGVSPEEQQSTLQTLRRHFGRIFAEAKDIDIDGVEVMPMGLPENYLRGVNVSSVRSSYASVRMEDKRVAVVAAWGKFMRICRFPHLERDHVACKSRHDAREWADSEVARQAGVEVRSIPAQDWWSEISRYRFLMSPLGAGVQSSKVIEALMMLTIPIVERKPYPAYDNLRRLGFPIVVVDDWSEVAVPGQLDAWWAELSPRLEHFREACLTAEGYWKYATGQDGGCRGV